MEITNKWPQLKNPPLREAFCDLRFVTTEGSQTISIDSLKEFCNRFKGDFPRVNQIFTLDVKGGIISDTATTAPQPHVNGYRLTNSERSFILQIQTDQFRFTKLKPYISWQEIQSEMRPILERFTVFFPQVVFRRIAVRYINEFNVQLSNKNPGEYFKILPWFPGDKFPLLEGYRVGLNLPNDERDLKSIVNFVVQSNPKINNTHQVIFDIDIFKEHTYESKNLDLLFHDFEKIRNFKNEIFFNSLTSETINRFN